MEAIGLRVGESEARRFVDVMLMLLLLLLSEV
jgi:hypothetical protein